MTRDYYDLFEYDAALSFAGEDRAVVEEFARLLTARKISVFYDEHETAGPEGGELTAHIAEIFRAKARYCVLFISKSYPLKKWTEAERSSAREHALRDANEYILPIRLDDTEVPGITEATGYRDLRQQSMESIVDILEQKLTLTKGRSGRPSRSHDLRSGNLPPKQGDL